MPCPRNRSKELVERRIAEEHDVIQVLAVAFKLEVFVPVFVQCEGVPRGIPASAILCHKDGTGTAQFGHILIFGYLAGELHKRWH